MNRWYRTRWLAGSKLTAAALDAEQDELIQRDDIHRSRSHGTGEAMSAIGSRILAVDRSVELTLHRADALQRVTIESGKKGAADFSLRSWIVAVGHDVLTLGWAAGSKITARVRGHLASEGLSCTTLQLLQSGPAPAGAKPFRLLRVTADRKAKTPERLMLELAAAGDPDAAKAKANPASADPKLGADASGAKPKVNSPPPGLRVGGASADGFVPLLEVIPGRGVVMRGKVDQARRIVRKPPGSEPSDEQLMLAFLRTEAGKKERDRIEKNITNLRLDVTQIRNATHTAGSGKVDFKCSLTNNQDIKLIRLKAMATLMVKKPTLPAGDHDPAPVWTELPPLSANTLANGGPPTGGTYTVTGPWGEAPLQTWLGVMIVGESDYGIVVTVFKEQKAV